MTAQEEQSLQDLTGPERRAYPRHAVDCAVTVFPLTGGAQMSGKLTDLSMGGCLVVTGQRYTPGILARVEVQFQLRGIAFRMIGVTAGNREAIGFAVRFLDMPLRRRQELAEVLAEVVALNAAKAAAAVSNLAAKPIALPEEPPDSVAAGVQPSIEPAAPTASGDRRSQSRHIVDTGARLLLVNAGISMQGRILNLSMGGCRIRTEERFNVGIYVRVEAEFYLHGLPFRVAGVSQAILDKNTIGIKFMDMSERRREQLAGLIAELAEGAAVEPVSGFAGSFDGAENRPIAG